MARRIRLTEANLKLMVFFLTHADDEHYGLRLAGALKLKTGTLYPLLHSLTALQWLERRQEAPGENTTLRDLGRPMRSFYRLTPTGRREMLETFQALGIQLAPSAPIDQQDDPGTQTQ